MSVPQPAQRDAFAAEGLAAGIVVMLAMTVIQRGLGFFRGILFCRWLDDAVVGQWAMAFGFITTVTPLMMLGLAGAMPRFVERYRRSGHLNQFISRVLLGTALGSGLVFGAMLAFPERLGDLVFRQSTATSVIAALAITTGSVLVFNFINELMSSLRQIRTVSLMQFIQGVGFTAIAIVVMGLDGNIEAIILSYAVSTGLAMLPGLWVLICNWRHLPNSSGAFDSSGMWRSLMPYALSLWLMNLLTNAFEMSDRYMILHLLPGDELAAQAAVGQYHSGRLIPTLLTSLAAMLGGVLMPYLTADWEEGEPDKVHERLGLAMFTISGGFTACSAITTAISPWLFTTCLQGRYQEGLQVQSLAFVFCIWGALIAIAQLYLWLHERGGLMAWILAVGLATNLLLNFYWLPTQGIQGAVWATLVANGVVMIGTVTAMHRLGYRFDSTIAWSLAVPLTLLTTWQVSLAVVLTSIVLHPAPQAWTRDGLDRLWIKRLKLNDATIPASTEHFA